MTKRFYQTASCKRTDDGYAIQLDDKIIKTPSGQDMVAPTQILADAIATEWAEQEETIKPDNMPLTQILTTALDKIRERDKITESVMRYLDTDLVCYWTNSPEDLAQKQKDVWGQWVKWFDQHFEVPLYHTTKIDAIKQDEEAHKRVWNYIEALDDTYFTILHIITSLSGSIVLALAFCEGDISEEELFEASYLEELYKGDIYNEGVHGASPDEEAERFAFKRDAKAAKEFLKLADG